MKRAQRAKASGSASEAHAPAGGTSGGQESFPQTPGRQPPAASSVQAPWRPTILAAGLIVLAAIAAYHNSFAGTFAYDDLFAIIENQSIRELWRIGQVLSPPASGETVSGRPLLNLSLAINYAISGLHVWSYHAVNLMIHIAGALVLFGILRRTFLMPALRDRFGTAAFPLALASTLVWTVHPLQTESVTYLVQRAEALAGLFYLLTLYGVIRGAGFGRGEGVGSLFPPTTSHVEYALTEKDSRPLEIVSNAVSGEKRDSASWSWYAAAVMACLLGMACKEVMVTAPLVVLLYDRMFLAGSFAAAWRQRWGLYAGLFATWGLLAALVFSTGLIVQQSEMGAPDIWGYVRSQPGVILHYLRLSFWPDSLCMSYLWPVANTLGETLPGAIVIGALAAATLWGLVGRKPWGFLGAWFFLILAPTSSILPLNQLAHDHRMYLSLAAVVVLAVAGGYALWDRLLPRPDLSSRRAIIVRWAAPVALLMGVLLSLGYATVVRNEDYHSPIAIWRDAVDKRPQNPYAQNNLGAALADLGEIDEAMEHYREALRLKPDHPEAHNNLGNALAATGKTEEAIEHYREALRLRPDYVAAHNGLATALASAGRTDEAIVHYRQALRLKPDYVAAHIDLATVLAELGRTEEAITHYREALRLKPDDADAHYNLGNALASLGSSDEAIRHYREALRLKPDDAMTHSNLGSVLLKLGRAGEAIAQYQEALRLKADDLAVENNLAAALAAVGRTSEAVERYNQILQRKPDFTIALSRLAWLLATREGVPGGEPARAVELAERARELGGQDDAKCLDTLAAAYAAAGRFPDAAITAGRAVRLAELTGQESLTKAIQARLELYRAGRPYREARR